MKRSSNLKILTACGIGLLGLSSVFYSILQTEKEKQEERVDLEESLTPEFAVYKQLTDQWFANGDESYVKVFLTSCEPMFFSKNPSYPEAGGLMIHTETRHMELLFDRQLNDPVILQALYWDEEEPDEQRVKHMYGPDRWYNAEDYMAMTQKNEPGFDVEYGDYGRIITGEQQVKPDWMDENMWVLPTEKGGKIYRFAFSEEKQEPFGRGGGIFDFRKEGSTAEQFREFVTDSQGNPIEYRFFRSASEDHGKERKEIRSRSRFLTRDSLEAKQMIEQMLERGPFIPKEVLELLQVMEDDPV